MLKGLVITGNRKIYEVFLREYNLNPQEYRYISKDSDLRGYHKDTNPNLRIVLLDKWWDNPVALWRSGSAGQLEPLLPDLGEFGDRVVYKNMTEIVLIDNITDPARLPEFLSSDCIIIREEAIKRLEELK